MAELKSALLFGVTKHFKIEMGVSEFNVSKHLCEVYELLLKDQVVIGLALFGERVQGYL